MRAVVFSGTTEGRRFSKKLAELGVAVTVCVATPLGAEEQGEMAGITVHAGPDGHTAMSMVFSDNAPLLEFCDRSTETGNNIQKGYMQMLAGAMSALRNPKAHANITITKDDAMRRLMFASMLMYKIDEAIDYSEIQER